MNAWSAISTSSRKKFEVMVLSRRRCLRAVCHVLLIAGAVGNLATGTAVSEGISHIETRHMKTLSGSSQEKQSQFP